jgi:glycoside/pentoside/hexuronide:cation symporter, GPH family
MNPSPTPAADAEPSGPEAHKPVPFLEKMMYGIGSGSYQLSNDGVKGLANPIFNITLGLNLALVGFVLMIARLFDAFTDPIIGKWSDDFRSRWGRRRPFIFVGSFLTAGAFILIWMVPESWKGDTVPLFTYYLLAMLLFYFCSTIQVVPYHTLGLEMSPDYHERTVIAGYKMVFSFIFTLFLPWVFFLAQSSATGGSTMAGMRYWSFIIAGAIVVGGVLPALFVKERYYQIACKQAKIPFWTGMKHTFQNRPFLYLTGIILMTGIGGGLVGAFGQYIVFYYMYEGDTKEGAKLVAQGANVFSVLAILSTPLVTWLSSKIGKVRMLSYLIILGMVASASSFLFYSKEWPYLIFIVYALQAPQAAGFWTLTTSMKADICDDDEIQHGMRREGMFGSVGGWVMKTSLSSTHFLSGLMLNATGLKPELGGDQSSGTFLSMRLLFAVVPILFALLSLFLLWKYPLNSKRMSEIRTILDLRRKTG